MSRIAVLGGGISGLSTAYYLSKLPRSKIQKVNGKLLFTRFIAHMLVGHIFPAEE